MMTCFGRKKMTVRKIVKIDEQKCDGCGQCIVDCPERALEIVDGKARVVKETYCDGLGACIGSCPLGAITIEEREAEAFDEEAVKQRIADAMKQLPVLPAAERGCPGSRVRQMDPASGSGPVTTGAPSRLSHWPVQLALVPPDAPFLQDADLLLVADCVPFALADFHERFLRGHPVVVGCPKLDSPQSYVAKLAEMLTQSSIRSLTIIRMEVPCCAGLCQIAMAALESTRRVIPISEVIVGVDGRVMEESPDAGGAAPRAGR
jgi:NAD-dependent dihydropyrimidine dehydrogenase PreA subunit